jgi:hypothetical protein
MTAGPVPSLRSMVAGLGAITYTALAFDCLERTYDNG